MKVSISWKKLTNDIVETQFDRKIVGKPTCSSDLLEEPTSWADWSGRAHESEENPETGTRS